MVSLSLSLFASSKEGSSLSSRPVVQIESEQQHVEVQKLEQKHRSLTIGMLDSESIIQEVYDTVTPQKLKGLARKYKAQYKEAAPFPHIVIDDIFPQRFLDAVEREIPESKVGEDGCYERNDICFKKKLSGNCTRVASSTNKRWDTTRASSSTS